MFLSLVFGFDLNQDTYHSSFTLRSVPNSCYDRHPLVPRYLINQPGRSHGDASATDSEKFLTKLTESKDVDTERIEQLRGLLTDGKKLKADDVVKIFSAPAGGDL